MTIVDCGVTPMIEILATRINARSLSSSFSLLVTIMSAALARGIFVLVLIINVLLWSNSRYTQSLASRSFHATEGSLVRRISHELLYPTEVHTSEDEVRDAHIILQLVYTSH